MNIASAGEEKNPEAAEEIVDVFECAKEAQVQASAEVAIAFRQMVNDPAYSDVAFLCSDGKRVHACKLILAGRSDMLRSMFKNGMAESNLSEIKMEVSSSVLLSVFEFLYTGTLLDNVPQNWRMSCEVIVASRFFLLSKLDIIIRKFMQTQIDSITENLPEVASLLTEAVGFKGLCEQTDVSLRVLVKILGSNLSDSTFVQSLSEDAFHYFLANSKGKCEDFDKLSFREYLRFRQVIRWWVHQSNTGSRGTEELTNFLAPDLNQGNLEVVESPEQDTRSLSDRRNSLQLDEVSRNAATRLLSNIDYRCIHPIILANVVEPLKISSAEVIGAFRFQALRRPMVFKTLEWEHGESYVTVEQGYVIHRTGTKPGLVIMNAAMSGPYGLFRWSFIFEEVSEVNLWVGFIYCEKSLGDWKSKLDCHLLDSSAWMLYKRGSKLLVNYQTACAHWKVLTNPINAISSVHFSFNAFKHTCSLSIDDQHFKDVWKDLPSGIYYPALSLVREGRGRVKLLSGFDLF